MNKVDLFGSEPGRFSCLRRTIHFADRHEHQLSHLLSQFPEEWDLGDKILCFIMPKYESLIREYYENQEVMLIGLLNAKEIRDIDAVCLEWIKALPELQPKSSELPREALIENYYEVKAALGRTPTLTELGQYGRYGQRTYHKKFGGYYSFLQLLNESPPQHRRAVADDQASCVERLKSEYLSAKARLGRPPKVTEVIVWDPDQFHKSVAQFGGWRLFVEEIEKELSA